MKRLRQKLEDVRPASAAVVFMATAVVLLFLSWTPFHVFAYRHENPEKVAGFAAAVNWSVGFTIFAPAALFFTLSALRSIRGIIPRLGQYRMIRDDAYQVVPNAAVALEKEWDDMLRKATSVVLVLCATGLVECVVEWWVYSGHPLFSGRAPAEKEFDWSVAWMGGSLSQRMGNALFSLLVFLLLQGPMIATVVGFCAFVTCFCNFVRTPGKNLQLVPNVEGSDPRCGFELFEKTAENLLFAAAFSYGVFYLTRLWNAYLHSAGYARLYDFVMPDLIKGFQAGGVRAGLLAVPQELLGVGEFSFSEVWVTLAALVVLSLSAATLVFVLWVAARDARQGLLQHLDLAASTTDAVTLQRQRDRLKQMKFWPVHYPGPNQLLFIGLFAAASIFFVRLGIFYFGLLLFVSVKKALESLRA